VVAGPTLDPLSFQSHAGSIEAAKSKEEGEMKEMVSIPRWFD